MEGSNASYSAHISPVSQDKRREKKKAGYQQRLKSSFSKPIQ
jgi:hypothetical protein